ncbi:MAG: OmpH family outer membrane protein [Parvularculaceae bacterium]
MKFKTIALAGAAALGMTALVGSAAVTSATAQAPKAALILIIDQQVIATQSAAGKTIPGQAQSIQNSVKAELQAEADKLKKDIENFQKNGSLMSEEVRTKTERELQGRAQYGLPQQQQIMSQAFDMAVQNAGGKILNEASPIIKTIVDKRGGTLLLDRSMVVYSAPESDITAEVIAELDKKLKTVAVERVSLAQIMKKLKEQAATQQAKAPAKK